MQCEGADGSDLKRGSGDLSSHIKGLHDQAVADKFPKWN